MIRLLLPDADATRAFGARLALALRDSGVQSPFLVGLSGELGAGKTTMVGGLLEALGHEGPVRSPTYSLVEPYRLAGRDVCHCDLYRLRDPDEIEHLGLRDLMRPGSIMLVEWPDRAGDRLRTADLSLRLAYADSGGHEPGRSVAVSAATEAGQAVLARLAVEPA
ncbi:MAG: tRNA (adenosine(37)-N6)-threonylcarbamoyltransferase complex ATPase subunit type 1 TsaE [Solirubrobacteraceae bacterium]|nr:tRNA (adenosine(37)-N6)-threonylcarbamoyltransferase complex ATPase subunit type 1 TsaE [Solirubrobacteraceae bacterium]